MQVYAVSGKGGVGKSTVSAMISVASAAFGIKTGWVDCDKQGEAISRTLCHGGDYKVGKNTFRELAPNLYGAAIVPIEFRSIVPKPDRDEGDFLEYMAQFPESYGVAAYNDMLNKFFGAFAQPDKALEVVNLSNVLHEAGERGIERVVLDLEPTKGMLGLITSAEAAATSLARLGNLNSVVKYVLGKTMPDIRRFLDSEYMKNVLNYSKRSVEAASALKGAGYVLVCGPQPAKVDEMLGETTHAIERFGGKVCAFAVNDLRYMGLIEMEIANQERQLARVRSAAREKNIPSFAVRHFPILEVDGAGEPERREVLASEGKRILKVLPEREHIFGGIRLDESPGLPINLTVEQVEKIINDAWLDGDVEADIGDLPDDMQEKIRRSLGLMTAF